jgi:hypothetical protein
MSPVIHPTAAELRERLADLRLERELARVEGLDGNALYMRDIERDIAGARAAFVGTAVTEIATLRGELSGRPQG